jgi:hypothetical protein
MVRRTYASKSMSDSTASSETEKECLGCGNTRALAEYSQKLGGLRARCKTCCNEEQRDRYHKSITEAEPVDDSEPNPKRFKSEPTVPGADLYIMALSTDPVGTVHGLKVGRSGNVPQRAMQLSASMPFNILVLATFPGAGEAEDAVHTILAPSRNPEGRGREWFHTPLPNILHAVACALQSQPIVNGGSASVVTGTE